MRKVNYLTILLLLLGSYSCKDELDYEREGIGMTDGKPLLGAVQEARAFFEEYAADMDLSTNVILFSPGNFAPDWSKAVVTTSEDSYITVNVPIVSEFVYQGLFYTHHDPVKRPSDDVYWSAAGQKLIVVKNPATGIFGCYILTVIPDKANASTNYDDVNRMYNSGDPNTKFSGTALFTIPGDKIYAVAAGRYLNGERYAVASFWFDNNDDEQPLWEKINTMLGISEMKAWKRTMNKVPQNPISEDFPNHYNFENYPKDWEQQVKELQRMLEQQTQRQISNQTMDQMFAKLSPPSNGNVIPNMDLPQYNYLKDYYDKYQNVLTLYTQASKTPTTSPSGYCPAAPIYDNDTSPAESQDYIVPTATKNAINAYGNSFIPDVQRTTSVQYGSSCVTAIMEYVDRLFGGNRTNEYFMNALIEPNNALFGKSKTEFVLSDGVPANNNKQFLEKYFKVTDINDDDIEKIMKESIATGKKQVIISNVFLCDLSTNPVTTTFHQVAIVGYNNDTKKMIYMDTFQGYGGNYRSGSLYEMDKSMFIWSYLITGRK